MATDRVRVGELARLALRGGRTDRLRIALTALATALAMAFVVAACVVASMPGPWFSNGWAAHYRLLIVNDPNLRAGIVVALLLMTMPPLALAAQAARVGGPARDRRLAAYRLVGASAREVRWVAGLEAGLAAVVGVVLGLAGYAAFALVMNSLAASRRGWVVYAPGGDVPSFPRQYDLPTDVVPHWWLVGPAVLVLPIVVVVVGRVALRAVDPLVLGQPDPDPRGSRPRWVAFVVAAAAALVGLGYWPLAEAMQSFFVEGAGRAAPIVVTALLALIEAVLLSRVVMALGRVVARVGGLLLVRRSSRAAGLVAGRRLLANPGRSGARSGALLLATLVAGVAVSLRGQIDQGGSWAMPNAFYLQAYDIVLGLLTVAAGVAALGIVATAAEAVVARRRELATLVAAGVPRRTLASSLAIEDLAPVLPALVVVMALGIVVPRVPGSPLGWGTPLSWGLALGFLAVAMLASAAGTALSLLFLPASVDIAEVRTAS